DGARAAWRGTWALPGGLDADLGHERDIGLTLAVTALALVTAAAQALALELLAAAGAGDLEAIRGALHRNRGGVGQGRIVVVADIGAAGDNAPADQRVWLLGRLRGEAGIVCALAAHRAEATVEIAAAASVDVGRATSETRHDVVGRPGNAG